MENEYLPIYKTTLEMKLCESPLKTRKKSSTNSSKISRKSYLEIILNKIKSSQANIISNNLGTEIKNKKIEIQKKLYTKSNDSN